MESNESSRDVPRDVFSDIKAKCVLEGVNKNSIFLRLRKISLKVKLIERISEH